MMNPILSFFKRNHFAILSSTISGILIGTSYIPFFPWAIAFCYFPLWYFLVQKSPSLKQAWIASWWTQFVLTLIGFHWVSFVAHEYGYLPWSASIFVLILFAACMHLYIPLSAVLGVWISRRLGVNTLAQGFIFASLLALGEIYWPSIFSWNLGYPLLWAKSSLAQWADVIGFQGLSYAVYLVNALLLTVILLKKSKQRFAILAGLGIFIALFSVLGNLRQEKWKLSTENPSENVRILKTLVIQANIGNFEKYQAEKGKGFQQEIVQEFFALTLEALKVHPDPDFVLWPESAVPDYLDNFALERKVPSLFRNFVQSIQKPVIAGAYSKDPPEQAKRKEYNGVFLFDQNGVPMAEPYRKTQLLIFGEYIPLVETFPIIAEYNPGGSGFGRGPGPTAFAFQDLKLGMQICYESLDPLFSAGLVKKGSDIFINITNDSWFGPRSEPYQNLWMTLARAVEMRRPLIRSTNTGITTAVLADGTVLEQSPLYAKWFGQYLIPVYKNAPTTLYMIIAPWLGVIILGFLVLFIFLGRQLHARNDSP